MVSAHVSDNDHRYSPGAHLDLPDDRIAHKSGPNPMYSTTVLDEQEATTIVTAIAGPHIQTKGGSAPQRGRFLDLIK